MRSIVKKTGCWESGILFFIYALSFVLPALGPDFYGWQAFLTGLIYCWFLPWTIPWWANVFFWLGLIVLRGHSYGKAAVFGLIAFLLGFSFLFMGGAGNPQAGYFLWVASMGGLLVTAAAKAARSEAEKSQSTSLEQIRSPGLQSDYFQRETCEQIASGPPSNPLVDFHVREE
jgi:hypothetical protein